MGRKGSLGLLSRLPNASRTWRRRQTASPCVGGTAVRCSGPLGIQRVGPIQKRLYLVLPRFRPYTGSLIYALDSNWCALCENSILKAPTVHLRLRFLPYFSFSCTVEHPAQVRLFSEASIFGARSCVPWRDPSIFVTLKTSANYVSILHLHVFLRT